MATKGGAGDGSALRSPAKHSALLAQLSQGTWFGGLETGLQQLILDRCQFRSLRRGEIIVQQGDPPSGLFGVATGQAAVTRWVDADSEVLIHIGDSGFWFGEVGLLAGIPAVGTVTAHTDLQLVMLSQAEFERLVDEEPRYYRDFARLALERYAIFLKLTADVRAMAPQERLLSRLADIVDLKRLEASEPRSLEIGVTQSELAEMIGVSRQTMNELLHRLEDDGIIELQFRKIRISDPGRLRSGRLRGNRPT